MKKKIHPKVREVIFWDVVKNVKFILQSTVETNYTAIINDKTYPMLKLETSSASHTAYTGERNNMSTVNNKVAQFRQKYNKK